MKPIETPEELTSRRDRKKWSDNIMNWIIWGK